MDTGAVFRSFTQTHSRTAALLSVLSNVQYSARAISMLSRHILMRASVHTLPGTAAPYFMNSITRWSDSSKYPGKQHVSLLDSIPLPIIPDD